MEGGKEKLKRKKGRGLEIFFFYSSIILIFVRLQMSIIAMLFVEYPSSNCYRYE